MTHTSEICDLCGLPLRHAKHAARFGDQTLHFCCGGCRMVYAMLLEASDAPDPSCFKQSELYQRCLQAGVVPADETDLERMANAATAAAQASSKDSAIRNETLECQYKVTGMWCPACAWVIREALDRRPGALETVCDFATDRLRCRYDPLRIDPRGIEETVQKLGYGIQSSETEGHSTRQRTEFIRLMICALLSMNVMMLSWALYSGYFTSLSNDDIRYISWPIVFMATGVMIYGGGNLFRKAWWGVRAAAPGMETLVSLGAAGAYGYSLHNFLAGSWHLYFDTAAMLITLVLLGKMLETRAKLQVRSDLEGFFSLQPNKVRLCSPGYPQGRYTDIGQLVPGDIFRVQAKEIVPADGRVLAGRGWVDESAVTGESRPKVVGPGDSMTSGTCLRKGDVTVTARRVGRHAMIGQMIAIVQDGLSRRTPLESRTDRWLALFVPVMVLLAGAAVVVTHGVGAGWQTAIVRGITVLVIACPCALGIAIPLARVAGMSQAGRKGILVRDFEAFERSTRVDTVVFDKTGTLTVGRWSLDRVEIWGEMSAGEVIGLAAGLEEKADHAIARAVAAYAREQGIKPAAVGNIHVFADGISGRYQGSDVSIGSGAFAAGRATELANGMSGGTHSPVYISLSGEVIAVLWFGDKIRDGARDLIRQLSGRGFSLYLVSGDDRDTTTAVARELGIAEVHGGLLPQDKAAFLARLQKAGRRVAMVGDGLNDAPALARADMSVAVHRDAALTRQAANVTLMRGDPCQLLDFLDLARRVKAKVTQNLACAWIYNLIGIPIAMSGRLTPLVAAIAMLLSSLTVIGNTLLLVRRK